MIREKNWMLTFKQGSWDIAEITQRTNQITGEVTEVPITRYTYISLVGAVRWFAEITASKNNLDEFIKDYERITRNAIKEAEELDKILTVKLKQLKKDDEEKTGE